MIGSHGATSSALLASTYSTALALVLAIPAGSFSVIGAAKSGVPKPPAGTQGTADTTAPPVPSITAKPASPSGTTGTSFSFTDAESGVSFLCGLDASAYAACSSPKAYSGLGQGGHTFAVAATDAAGNLSGPATWAWTVDTVAPPAPVLVQKPPNPAPGATNTFAWIDAEAGVTFQCSVENGAWQSCTSPYTYVIDTDNNGRHQFAVRAVDAAGNVSAATSYKYRYDKVQPESGVSFQIAGSVSGLTIGIWKPIVLTITNPNTAPIYVTSLTVTVSADSTPPGCLSAPNVEVQQPGASVALPVLVPAGGTVTLPTGAVTTPQIRIKDLPDVNQDVCKNKSFVLTYSGTANN